LKEGTPDWEIHEDLLLPKSVVFANKHHGSCFQGTGLDRELKQQNIDAVVIAGLVTHGCVRASSLDALKLGYDVTLVSDAHSSYNRQAEALRNTWNKKIAAAGAHLEKEADVSFA
jgi:nicotinamidase-related amidase